MNFVSVTRDAVLQIVNQETGIALLEINDGIDLGAKTETIAIMCGRRFGISFEGRGSITFGELCRKLGV